MGNRIEMDLPPIEEDLRAGDISHIEKSMRLYENMQNRFETRHSDKYSKFSRADKAEYRKLHSRILGLDAVRRDILALEAHKKGERSKWVQFQVWNAKVNKIFQGLIPTPPGERAIGIGPKGISWEEPPITKKDRSDYRKALKELPIKFDELLREMPNPNGNITNSKDWIFFEDPD